ncbi:proprotein convertase subtilisin/kexin type 5 [Drosophila eugracilis]|uniref:proprotein convertase subtilisin/kexin type 5 n=1 Tax=Drosophila eugracilis TaxID=29029 RepID=UPI001BDA3ACA|nr:proprotein convertase subtilisin/kexin type 5 [Drosophila eugracilis]
MAQYRSKHYGAALCLMISLFVGSLNAECCKEGEKKVDADDCTKYLVCCHGEFVSKSCASGDYWNSETELCVEDNGECNPPTCQDGEIEANPDDCAGYLECINGVVVILTCADGDYFNSTLKKCVPDTCGVCVNCTEGSVKADLNDCAKFQECINGKYVSQSCATDYYWNPESKKCEKDEGQCNGNSTCTEGELEVDPTDCAGYLICSNGNWVSKECPSGSFFNETLKTCEVDSEGVCVNCTEGSQKPEPNDCTKYQICSGGKYVTKSCESGYYWNNQTLRCEEDNGQCNGNSTCTEGELEVDPTDCAGYLICSNGNWVSKECPSGSFFNETLKTCEVDSEGVCVNCTEGSQKPEPNDCTKYQICSGGKYVTKSCESGYYWNNQTLRCEEDNGQCNGNSTCTEGELEVDPTDCAGYLICSNGNWVSKECPSGSYFNETLKACEIDSEGICVNCTEGSQKPEPNDCTKYQICSGGKYVTKSCESGYYWNNQTLRCEEDNGQCNGNSTCTENEVKENPSDCAGYLQCINGNFVARKCSAKQFFNTTLQECVLDTENVCIPKTCDPDCCDVADNTIWPVENNCTAFFQCVDGNKFEQTCSNNLQYNSKTEQCDFPENVGCDDGSAPPSGPNAGPSGTYCESNGRCLGKPDGTMLPDASGTCSSAYIVCQCECEINFSCSSGLIYNADVKSCDWPDSVKC